MVFCMIQKELRRVSFIQYPRSIQYLCFVSGAANSCRLSPQHAQESVCKWGILRELNWNPQ